MFNNPGRGLRSLALSGNENMSIQGTIDRSIVSTFHKPLILIFL